MEIESFFFDTYALYEIAAGNRAYEVYASGVAAVTTRLNLMELYYGLLAAHGKKAAERYYDAFIGYAVDIGDDTIKRAMEFKLANKSRNLSYVDCIGYTLARQRNIRFLTGDREFKDMPGVEHVK
ncbi:MAG: PIN domain-containing protein [Candidatus Altiarchaeota archaeon]